MDKDVSILGAGWLGIISSFIEPLTQIFQFVAVVLGVIATIFVIREKWLNARVTSKKIDKTED